MNRSRTTSRLGARGSSTLEFAAFAAAGVMIASLGVDFVNYARTRMRLDEVASGTASYVSTYQQLYAGDFPGLYKVAQQTAGNVDVTQTAGAVIFTGITNPNGTPTVAWRQQTGSSSFTSNLGTVGGAPTNLWDGYAPPVGGSVVAVEVFTTWRPWGPVSMVWVQNPTSSKLGAVNMFQPRAALLAQVTPGNRP